MQEIKNNLSEALEELLSTSFPKKGDILVIGCSTSEVLGDKIGTNGSRECGQAIYDTVKFYAEKYSIFVAAQCCEHLNRALVVERELALAKGLCIVEAVPHERAGGSWATSAYRSMKDPVLVEEISADFGIDIGDTIIGMHLKRVAVPVRTKISYIGSARLVCARTRPKYIGGERAKYN